ncbi:transposase [Salmonella enterica]|nr:transposase [Salmonella enterica]
MKKSRFTDNQIMSILKQAEAGAPVAELCREHGMSNAVSISGVHVLAVWSLHDDPFEKAGRWKSPPQKNVC